MTNEKSDLQKISEKLLERLAGIFRDYNYVVGTVSQQKAFQTVDYDDLSDKMTHATKGIYSIETAVKKMADNKMEIPNLLPVVEALKNAAESYDIVLLGLKNKAHNTGRYGFFAYRKDLNNFEEKRIILAVRQREFSKGFSSPEKNDNQYELDSKTITVQSVANSFVRAFLENIDKRRDEIIEALSSKEGSRKLSVSEDKAQEVLFYSFLAFWTLPLFNLFDEELANDILNHICVIIGDVLKTDATQLAKITLDIRDYFNSTIVDNAQHGMSSAWLGDNLVDDYDIFDEMLVGTILFDSLIFDWKKLSKEHVIK